MPCALERGDCTERRRIVQCHDDIDLRMCGKHIRHDGHGDLKLTTALGLRDDLKGGMILERRTKALNTLRCRVRLGMFQQRDPSAVRMGNEMLCTLRTRTVVFRYNGRGDIPLLCNVRVNGDDDDVRGTRLREHCIHACAAHGGDEEDAHTVRDESADLLNLTLRIKRGVA